MPNYNPYEQQKLQSLIPALRQGLDPALALDIFSGVESGALNRMAENRAMRQQAFSGAASQLREAAAGGTTQAGAMDLVNSYQAEMPGLGKGRYQGRLEDLVRGGLYQGPGQMSSLYQPEPTEAAPGLDPQYVSESIAEAQAIAAEAAERQKAVRAAATSVAGLGGVAPAGLGEDISSGPTSLHDLRMQLMKPAVEAGFSRPSLEALFDAIGRAFQAAGGDIGEAPLTGYGTG